jgi:hypothetical protein
MYDRTYVTIRRLFNELNRIKYNHIDEEELFESISMILEKIKELENNLKKRIEG